MSTPLRALIVEDSADDALMMLCELRGGGRNAQDENARHLLKMMESSAERGASIIKQVLTFARGVEGERLPVQPRNIIREIMSIAAETFPKDIRVESDIAADVWQILGDPTQLHQALLNLCINARDAMPKGGVLTLKAANIVLTEQEAGRILGAHPGTFDCLSVIDTGTAFRQKSRRRSSSLFSLPRTWAKAPDWDCPPCWASYAAMAVFFGSSAKLGRGPRLNCPCRPRQPRTKQLRAAQASRGLARTAKASS